MATTLYFHDAANALTGTFPTNTQSATVPTVTATGATTLRTMDTSVGAAQASRAVTTAAATAQTAFMAYFCSNTLNLPQTVGGGSMVLNGAEAESSNSANFWINAINIYVWRPSSGTKVGTILDSAGTSLGGTEPTSTNSEQVTHITGIATSAVSALGGDVIICEVWVAFTQQNTNQYTGTFYYDGTTVTTTENAAVSNHASYVQLAETLTFGTKVDRGSLVMI